MSKKGILKEIKSLIKTADKALNGAGTIPQHDALTVLRNDLNYLALNLANDIRQKASSAPPVAKDISEHIVGAITDLLLQHLEIDVTQWGTITLVIDDESHRFTAETLESYEFAKITLSFEGQPGQFLVTTSYLPPSTID